MSTRRLVRDGVALAYTERGAGDPPLLLVHGILSDVRYVAPQLDYFGRTHRTVAVDLRGHGRSDAPDQPYTIDGYADDLAWVSEQLELGPAVAVAHSLGGIVAVDLASRRPDLVRGVVALDSVLVPGRERAVFMTAFLARLRTADYLPALREYFARFFGPTDDADRRRWILDHVATGSAQVAISTWEDGTFRFDDAAAIARCRMPFLYLDAGTPNVDLVRLRELAPHLIVGRTVGCGHFLQLEVPDQVNAMIARFLKIVAAVDGA